MKKFRFPLDRVLAFRRLAAEAEQANLERCRAALQAVDAEIAAWQWRDSGERHSVRQMEAAELAVDTVALNSYPGFRNAAHRSRSLLENRRRQAVQQLELQRSRTIAAHQARELLERARQMAQKRWTEDFNRESEQIAADLYLAGWKRINK